MTEINIIRNKNINNLKKIFGYDEFRSMQEQVTTSISMKNDTLVLMQTGGGKSLCFQIPALTLKQNRDNKGLCIVISPLKALIRDQVHDINHTGKMTARYLIADDHGQMSRLEHNHTETMKMLADGKLDFLYLAPERLEKNCEGNNRVIDTILKNNIPVNLIVFDEAHYTLMTSEEFRPSYLKLSELIEDFPDATRVALTATADIFAQREIIKRTGLRKQKVFIDDNYSRNHSVNITIDTGEKAKRIDNMFSIISPLRERCGIVYANRKKKLKELYKTYENHFPEDNMWYYDGETPQEKRMTIEDEFQIASDGIIFATNAFGMGINKSDIYYVYHDGCPRAVSDFVQEIGRAGRDRSISSSSYAFMSYNDIENAFSQQNDTKSLLSKRRYSSLVNAIMSTKCRNVLLAESLGVHAEPCGMCDNCSRPIKTLDIEDSNNDAVLILELLDEMSKKKKAVTRKHIADILRGINSARGNNEKWQFLKSFGKASQGKQLNYWDNIIFYMIGRGFVEFNISKLKLENGFETTISHVILNAEGRRALRSRLIVDNNNPVRFPAEGKKESDRRVIGKRLKQDAPEFMHKMMGDLLELVYDLSEESNLEDVKIVSDDTLINIVETGKISTNKVNIHPMIDFSQFEKETQKIIDKYYPKKSNTNQESVLELDW